MKQFIKNAMFSIIFVVKYIEGIYEAIALKPFTTILALMDKEKKEVK